MTTDLDKAVGALAKILSELLNLPDSEIAGLEAQGVIGNTPKGV